MCVYIYWLSVWFIDVRYNVVKLLCSVFVDSSISSKLVLIGGGRFEDWVVVALVESEVVRMLD